MSTEDWLSLAVVILCLFLSAFFSGSETGLTTASRAAMRRLQKQGNRRALAVNSLLAARQRMLRALLFGNSAVNIAAASLMAGLFLSWFGGIGVIYATVLMTFLVVVFSEVLPKIAAFAAPDRTALMVAKPVAFLVRLVDPIVLRLEALSRGILQIFGIRPSRREAEVAREELRGTVDLLHTQGSVEKLDRDMLGGLLDLRELEVSDVMIHRTEMVTVNADEPPQAIVEAVLVAPVTRLPLWREKPENIVGMLHAKDILRALQAAGGDAAKVDIAAIATPPWFVPDTTPLAEQLKAFRRRKTHFALVVDEYGEVMGLVTLEDIIEEIVGDISDEHDIDVPGVRPQIDGSVQCDGSVPIRDLNRAMDWSLPDDEATTIAGLVIHEARSIPEVGQSFTFHGFRFRVVRKTRNRITVLRITPLTRRPALPAA
jgi:Mg2+/Co2+ transporter CorB